MSGGKKQLPDHHGKKHKDDEIVKLQRPAQCGEQQRFVILARQSLHSRYSPERWCRCAILANALTLG